MYFGVVIQMLYTQQVYYLNFKKISTVLTNTLDILHNTIQETLEEKSGVNYLLEDMLAITTSANLLGIILEKTKKFTTGIEALYTTVSEENLASSKNKDIQSDYTKVQANYKKLETLITPLITKLNNKISLAKKIKSADIQINLSQVDKEEFLNQLSILESSLEVLTSQHQQKNQVIKHLIKELKDIIQNNPDITPLKGKLETFKTKINETKVSENNVTKWITDDFIKALSTFFNDHLHIEIITLIIGTRFSPLITPTFPKDSKDPKHHNLSQLMIFLKNKRENGDPFPSDTFLRCQNNLFIVCAQRIASYLSIIDELLKCIGGAPHISDDSYRSLYNAGERLKEIIRIKEILLD